MGRRVLEREHIDRVLDSGAGRQHTHGKGGAGSGDSATAGGHCALVRQLQRLGDREQRGESEEGSQHGYTDLERRSSVATR